MKKGLECIVIYGRRRVGKTAIINEFTKDKPTIYFPALNTNAQGNLTALSKAIYHKYYDLNFFGDYYRLANPFEQVNLVAWESVARDKSEALVTVITVNLTVNGPQEYIKCKGLAPDRYYRLERDNVQIVASGMAFMHAGIPIPREIPEFTAFIYHLTAID